MIFTKDYNFNNYEFKLPEDLGKRVALGLLDEIFSGGVIDSANQPFLLLMMSLASSDNICSAKVGRVTQQSIAMLRHIKKFINVSFKIEECEDNVFSSDSEEEEEENNKDKQDEEIAEESQPESEVNQD